MKNILPEFKSFNLREAAEAPVLQWSQEQSLPTKLNVKSSLLAAFANTDAKDKAQSIVSVNRPPLLAPNERYLSRIPAYGPNKPSPIADIERGIPDKPKIVLPPDIDDKQTEKAVPNIEPFRAKPSEKLGLGITVYNFQNKRMEVYVQRPAAMQLTSVKPDCFCSRTIVAAELDKQLPPRHHMPILFASMNRVMLNMTELQELRDIVFDGTPIGLVMETIEGNLVCIDVLADSRASQYAQQLQEAEVVAVDGHRVDALEDFQSRVAAGLQQHGTVTIKFLISLKLSPAQYARRKQRVDEAYRLKKQQEERFQAQMKNPFLRKKIENAVHSITAARTFGGEGWGGIHQKTSMESPMQSTLASARGSPRKVFAVSPPSGGGGGGGVGGGVVSEQRRSSVAPAAAAAVEEVPTSPSSPSTSGKPRKRRGLDRRSSYTSYMNASRFVIPDTSLTEAAAALSPDNGPDGSGVLNSPLLLASPPHSVQMSRKPSDASPTGLLRKVNVVSGLGVDTALGEEDRMMANVTVHRPADVSTDPFGVVPWFTDREDVGSSATADDESERSVTSKIEKGDINNNDINNNASIDWDAERAWEYTTAGSEIESFPRIVCVPKPLQASREWGTPASIMQISNIADDWNLTVYWIDPDGNAVMRTNLVPGAKHNEMTCPTHVWAIVATPSERSALRQQLNQGNGTAKLKLGGTCASQEESEVVTASPEAQVLRPSLCEPNSIILRPSKGCLIDSKCTTVIWIPHNSVTVVQRPHHVLPPAHKVVPGRFVNEALQVHLHVQVLYSESVDIAAADRETGTHKGSPRTTGSSAIKKA